MISLYEFLVKGKYEAPPKEITLDMFIKDIEKLFDKYKIEIVESGKHTTNKNRLCVFTEQYKDKTYYTLSFAEKETYSEEHYGGYHYRTNSFKLRMYVWYSEELKRPRYEIEEFHLLLPATTKQGYYMDRMKYYFKSTKVLPEHYNSIIDYFDTVISIFVNNTDKMDKMFQNCRKKQHNPQRADFNKIFDVTYKKLTEH